MILQMNHFILLPFLSDPICLCVCKDFSGFLMASLRNSLADEDWPRYV